MIAIATLVTSSGCGSPAGLGSGNLSSVAGFYELTSVPIVLRVSLCCANQIMSGTLRLAGNGTYEVTTRWRGSFEGNFQVGTNTEQISGTYSLESNSKIVFTDDNGPPVNGDISGDTITTVGGPLRVPGRFYSSPFEPPSFVYRKADSAASNIASVIEVSPTQDSLFAFGARLQLSAAADNGSGLPIGDKIFAWSSSDSTIVAVDDSGVATGVSNGTATIAAAADDAVGEARITVLAEFAVTHLDPLLGAAGINDSGVVAGGISVGPRLHAALYRNGAITDLGTLGEESFASDINNRGQVVGSDRNATTFFLHAFLWDPLTGQLNDLGTLGGFESHANAINDSGQVVGMAQTASGERHAFLWENGVMRDLGSLGPSEAFDINNQGVIVAQGSLAAAPDLDLRQGRAINELGETVDVGFGETLTLTDRNGEVTEIVLPFSLTQAPLALSECRQIVGTAQDGFRQIGFLWENGRFHLLRTVTRGGEASSHARDINQRGQVVGSGEGVVLWTPPGESEPIRLQVQTAVLWTVPSCTP